MNVNDLFQAIIFALGGAAIWLISRNEPWGRWGFVVGLTAQPFWMYSTWTTLQYGMFFLSIWYTYSYCEGIRSHFDLPGLEQKNDRLLKRIPRCQESTASTSDQLQQLAAIAERLGLSRAAEVLRNELAPAQTGIAPHPEGWIGVDLDGTLAHDDGFVSAEHIGPPVPKMAERVRQLIAQGKDVRIFTARVDGGRVALSMGFAAGTQFDDVARIRRIIQDYTELHFGVRLPVTNRKDFGMRNLFDDRVTQILKNTGERADGMDDLHPMPPVPCATPQSRPIALVPYAAQAT